MEAGRFVAMNGDAALANMRIRFVPYSHGVVSFFLLTPPCRKSSELFATSSTPAFTGTKTQSTPHIGRVVKDLSHSWDSTALPVGRPRRCVGVCSHWTITSLLLALVLTTCVVVG